MMDFKKILAVVLVVVCVSTPGNAAVPTCPTDSSEVCFDCITRGVCSVAGGPAAPGTACPAGQACKMVTGVATCMALSTVPECNCGGANAGCDAYDTDVRIFCAPPGAGRSVYIAENCADNNETCVDGQCVAATSSSCAGHSSVSFVLSTPTCTSGIFCNKDVEVFTDECEAGEFFNLAKSACEAYPPNPCDGCTKKKCPIITDCSKYAVCSNGVAADNDESCEEDQYFNPEAEDCSATEATGVCADYEKCVFESTTAVPPTTTSDSDDSSPDDDTPTTTPTTLATTTTTTATTTTKPPCTSSNANQRYPHETNCKKYYTCREVSRNTFKYVDGTCPTPYVFNPTILKCDLVSKVPACQTSAT